MQRHRRTIIAIKESINKLADAPESPALLLTIQERLFGQLRQAERNIRALKARRRAVQPSDIARLDDQVRQYQFLHSLWRSFGDAIAFTYASKWDIKPLAYNAGNPHLRPSAGFITGKAGIRLELAVLRRFIAAGYPAVLCDATSSLRHGDVAVLGAGPPVLIECKGRSSRNRRSRRQLQNVRAVSEYLRRDVGSNYRGAPIVHRADSGLPDIDHVQVVNAMIEEAASQGQSYRELEPGQHCVLVRSDQSDDLSFRPPRVERAWVFALNDYKNEGGWVSYRPYTLWIRDPKRLFDFIAGHIVAFVVLDVARVEAIARSHGYETLWHTTGDWAFEFSHHEHGTFSVSEHYVTRAALEMASMSNLIERSFRLWHMAPELAAQAQ